MAQRSPDDDLVARMIAAAPSARRCCDPAEEFRRPSAAPNTHTTGDHAVVGELEHRARSAGR